MDEREGRQEGKTDGKTDGRKVEREGRTGIHHDEETPDDTSLVE
jgi:hypothetical protein